MATLHGDPKPADDTEETEAVPEAEPMEEDYEIKTPGKPDNYYTYHSLFIYYL